MACGFIESALSNTVGTLLVNWVTKPVKTQLDYVRHYYENIEKFGEKKEELPRARERLQHEIQESENQLLEIEADIQALISKVDETLEDMSSLEMEIQQNKKCLKWCPNWWWQYRLSKKLEKKTLPLVSELIEKLAKHGKQDRVGYHGTIIPTVEFLSLSENFQVSKASNEAFKQITDALQDDNVSMIGLWGMGGVGKTTLVCEVGNQSLKCNLFDRVVIATVSKHPNFEKIQDEIAKEILFDMKNEQGERKHAKELLLRLKKEKRILIILDDVWIENIDLKREVGIPVGEDPKACKVILTTRRYRVCERMECQATIELGYLDLHEAQELFEKKADLHNINDEDIRKVAAKIINKCQGLPIVLITLGSALKGQDLHSWRSAYRRLKSHRLDEIEGIENTKEENVYLSLEMSFDFLKGRETKICFLLCSLFPEDHEIYMEDLVRYAWGLELYKGIVTVEEVRSEVFAAIVTLKKSCLLLDARESHVKMHDMVRDVALWISSHNRSISFTIKSEVIETWPKDEFQSFTAISLLIVNQKVELPADELVSPDLKILLLRGDNSIPSKFFEGMKTLKVCSLHGSDISIDAFDGSQIDLRSLHLNQCELPTISVLGKLKKLEILSLNQYNIIELPKEIGDLNNLRVLDLSNCRSLKRIPPDLISRLSRLEELYLEGCLKLRWANAEDTSVQKHNASLFELSSLSNSFKILSLNVSSKDVPKDFVFPKLERYYICIAKQRSPYSYYGNYNFSRLLKVDNFSRSLKVEGSALHACKHLFRDLDSLSVEYLEGFQNLFPSFGTSDHGVGFNKLTSLDLGFAKHMKYLIDATTQEMITPTAFLNLVKLSLFLMDDLEKLCNGPHPRGFLQNLKNLSVRSCKKLIYAIPVLQNLEQVEVDNCHRMQAIFEEEVNSANFRSSRSLQNLKVVSINLCTSLKYIFPASVAKSLGRLEELVISSCLELEEIIQKTDASNVCLQSLQKVVVQACRNLTSLTSLCHGQILENLKSLEIWQCHRLEYTFPTSMAEGGLPQLNVFYFDGSSRFDRDDIVFTLPSLQQLHVTFGEFIHYNIPATIQVLRFNGGNYPKNEIATVATELSTDVRYTTITNLKDQLFDSRYNLSKLRLLSLTRLQYLLVIWKGPIRAQNFQCLAELDIHGCTSLLHVFSTAIAQNLLQLMSLSINDCPKLEDIIEKDETSSQQLPPPPIRFPNLTLINISNCPSLKSVFTVSVAYDLPKLTVLRIHDNSKLEQVFEDEEDVYLLDQHKIICLPQLHSMSLFHLPCLVSFIPNGFEVVFPSLKDSSVKELTELIQQNVGHIPTKTEPIS